MPSFGILLSPNESVISARSPALGYSSVINRAVVPDSPTYRLIIPRYTDPETYKTGGSFIPDTHSGLRQAHAQIRYKATEKRIPAETMNLRKISPCSHGEAVNRSRLRFSRLSNRVARGSRLQRRRRTHCPYRRLTRRYHRVQLQDRMARELYSPYHRIHRQLR